MHRGILLCEELLWDTSISLDKLSEANHVNMRGITQQEEAWTGSLLLDHHIRLED